MILTPLTFQLPLPGWDWYRVFYLGAQHMYPPWVVALFAPFRLVPWRLSYAWLIGFTCLGVALMTACQATRIRWDGLLAAGLALLTPPLFYLLWDGQIDGLVVVGLFYLPWSMPLILLRPQSLWPVILSRRRWAIAAGAWLLISLIVWGWWPPMVVERVTGSLSHPTAMGWMSLGWPIFVLGLAMLAASRGDRMRQLAACLVAAPYLQPYHMTLLLPALGCVTGWRRWSLWGWAWVVGLVPAFLGLTRYLALGFPIAVWILLRDHRREETQA